MRIDKWIWAVRMTKTRTLAAKLCDQGKVLLNDQKIKGSKNINLGDIITVHKEVTLKYEVIGFIEKRVGAEKAREFYTDHSPIETIEGKNSDSSQYWGQREKGEGRPTKKDRRAIEKIKNW